MLSLLRRCDFYILILLITTFLTPSISFSDANKIFKENSKAVVVILTYDAGGNPISQGSGFVVRSDGAIVTNYHVISNAEDIKVKMGEKVLEVKGLIHLDKENDIVILKAEAKELPIVKIEDKETVEVGDRVYVISSPQGLENTVSDGVLSGIREIDSKRKILQITAPVSSGSSGSPVFNSKGEVIGVATFLIQGGQNLNFAMPINLIKDKFSAKKLIALKDAELEEYKKTAEYWLILGYYLAEAELYKDAIEACKQAIRLKPDLAEAHYNMGVHYGKLGMYREELEACKQAIRIKPNLAEAHNNMGFAYGELGMHKESIEASKQAIRIKPDLAEAHNNLGVAYAKSGMHRESIEASKQAIRIKPDYAEAHYNLGVAYYILSMYKESIEAFKQAIRIKPDYAEAHYNLGISYLILNDSGSALEQYKILKSLEPEQANKLFNLIYK